MNAAKFRERENTPSIKRFLDFAICTQYYATNIL